jgi:hypothetical protein
MVCVFCIKSLDMMLVLLVAKPMRSAAGRRINKKDGLDLDFGIHIALQKSLLSHGLLHCRSKGVVANSNGTLPCEKSERERWLWQNH